MLLVPLAIAIYTVWPAGFATHRRATGHLPLTRASRRLVRVAFWGPVALLPLGGVALVIAVMASSSGASPIAWAFFLIGVVAPWMAFLFSLVGTPLISPRGEVFLLAGQHDRLVDISNVHPVFIKAVQERNRLRYAQSYSPRAAITPQSK